MPQPVAGPHPTSNAMLITSPYEQCISVQVSLRTMFLSTRNSKTASEYIVDAILALPTGEPAPARAWGHQA
jgi:hypothetical protein